MERAILHSDMNCFYASVEQMLDPTLRGKAIAVCGSQETRHGIVLAKSQLAKKAGVKTGMAIWQAKECCRDLIVVPPQYDQYLKYSRLAHEIYLRYTDRMEPYGMDECWLDLTGCRLDPVTAAEEIRATTKSELGLTVSIGVSFNKIFAKLGSDMKKPDAMTVITLDNFRDLVWPLPASDLLYCGPATTKKLANYGIHTIGDIAATAPEYLRGWLGVNGIALWHYASGTDTSRVMTDGWEAPIKSVGHGVTCVSDLLDDEEVWRVILELSQDVGHRLRVNGFLAKGVQIMLRDNSLFYKQYQTTLEIATRSPKEIAEQCFALFKANYRWQNKVRALCVRAISLVPEKCPQQLTIFDDPVRREKQDKMDAAIEDIRRRYGKRAVYSIVMVKGNFEPIVSEELWRLCEKKRKAHIAKYEMPDGETRRRGASAPQHLWVRKLRCRCGSGFSRFKWRTNMVTGLPVYGYQCIYRTTNPTKSFVETHQIKGQKSCDEISICEWKLEMMAKHIFSHIWGDQQQSVSRACQMIESCVAADKALIKNDRDDLSQKAEKIKKRIMNYGRMRADEELSKEQYKALCSQAEEELDSIKRQLATIVDTHAKADLPYDFGKIQKALARVIDVSGAKISDELIDEFVEVVTPVENYAYRWKLNLGETKSAAERTDLTSIDTAPILSFVIDFEAAQKYRQANNMPQQFRRAAWTDLRVEVYL